MHRLKIIATILFSVLAASVAYGSTPDKPAPVHNFLPAPDLVDVVRFATGDAKPVKAAEDAVIVLGDYLKTKGTVYEVVGIAAKPIAKDESYAYKYGNYLLKVSESVGVRMIEASIPALEERLLAADPGAVYALPFRFVVLPASNDNASTIHICLVDPYSYLSQFTPISPALAKELEAVRNELMEYIKAAFPRAFFDPSFAAQELPTPEGVTALVKIAETTIGDAGLEGIAKKIQAGNLLMTTSEPPRSYKVNDAEHPTDPQDILPEKTLFKGILSFSRFSAIKDGKDGKTEIPAWKIADQSPQMECLVQNSVIHVFGKTKLEDLGQRIKYSTSAGEVYQLQVFDGYLSPFWMNTGVSRFASLPISVYVRETEPGSGKAGIYLQNPHYLVKRYYHEVTDEQLAQSKKAWDAIPQNKTKWPDMNRDQMAQFTLDKISKLVGEALK